MRLRAACFVFLLFPGAPASGADIMSARYDARTDEIVVRIAYRGTNPRHNFRVEWGPCERGRIAGRVIDEQGSDAARTGYRVTERVGLRELPCRPALVTLRLGRIAHAGVRVPARDLANKK